MLVHGTTAAVNRCIRNESRRAAPPRRQLTIGAVRPSRSDEAGARRVRLRYDVRMGDPPPAHEGFVSFRGRRTWYRDVGRGVASDRLPLVVVHGGPGVPHGYLEPLEEWADAGRRVVFYDQLGCGASDHPHDLSLWTVELFVSELLAVREALGLERCHLLGQSWGALLSIEHVLAHPDGIATLTLADPLVSAPQWCAEAAGLRAQLPSDLQEALTRCEADGTTDSPAYEAAMLFYYRRHVCRLDPWPACLMRALDALAEDPEVYRTMWGPSEFHCTGTLRDWDVSDRLAEIAVPTLVLGGRHDECTPAIQEAAHRAIPDSEWIVFEESSHAPHLEERERFRAVVEDFLERAETGVV
jgi:proline-specific peptidase